VYRIGFLFAGTIALRPQSQEFWRKLQALGYVEGKDFIAEVREARGDVDRLPKLAAEIVDTHPDVIVAVTPPAVAAAKMATQAIPIVMAIVPDPVGSGFVKSLAHAGTNITGSSSLMDELAAKRIQLIKEMLPELSLLGILWNEKSPTNAKRVRLGEQAARSRCVWSRIGGRVSTGRGLRRQNTRRGRTCRPARGPSNTFPICAQHENCQGDRA
jgi:putative ABC transport system substrate-binding protein